MSERDLVIECIPQITEMTMVIQEMTRPEYEEFKQEHLDEVRRTCPTAVRFITNIYKLIEWVLSN